MPNQQKVLLPPPVAPIATEELPSDLARVVIYARNMLAVTSRASRQAKAITGWACEHGNLLQLTLPDAVEDGWERPIRRNPPAVSIWRQLRQAFDVARGEHTVISNPSLLCLAKEMSLSPTETAALQFMVDYETCKPCEDLWDRISDALSARNFLRCDPSMFAGFLGVEASSMAAALSAKGTLRSSGLIRVDSNNAIHLLGRLHQLIRETVTTASELRSSLLGPQQAASLTMSDFAHIGQDAERVLTVLRGALAERAKGIVVALYGPPGTGKTEMAKTLAAALEVPLHSVGEADDNGGEPTRDERLSELQLAQRLLGNAEPTLLLFDEAEDLFSADSGFSGMFRHPKQRGSRAYIHRLLENAQVPIILTANNLEGFGPAVLRRMTCCLEIKVPPASVRTALWTKAALDEGVVVPTEELQRLGRQLPASPAMAAMAMRTARLGGGDPDTVRWAVTGVMTAMNKGQLPQDDVAPDIYDPSLVSADIDLATLADRLSAPNATRAISLLLSGVSGSGKSAYARYLAHRMELEVLHKRASDLLGMYVGQSEKQIAAAFTEAADTKAFLVFDEADSLLGDRRGAQRQWEISQVNEMLTWMERHRHPFCCTTNLLDHVDPAAMRRFLVKAKFGYLRPDQVELAFRRIFECEPPRHVRMLTSLTPADFDLVKRTAELQGYLGNPIALAEALEREQLAKPGTTSAIGFHGAH